MTEPFDWEEEPGALPPGIEMDVRTGKYAAVCDTCHYVSNSYTLQSIADTMLRRHLQSRNHKVLAASPNRFTV